MLFKMCTLKKTKTKKNIVSKFVSHAKEEIPALLNMMILEDKVNNVCYSGEKIIVF